MELWDWLTGRSSRGTAKFEDTIWISDAALLAALDECVLVPLRQGHPVLLTGHFSDELGSAVEVFQKRQIPFRAWNPPSEREQAVRDLQRSVGTVLICEAGALPSSSDESESSTNWTESPAVLYALHHHPDVNEDRKLLRFAAMAGIPEVEFLTSLDHPLFQRFAGKNIQQLLRSLGMSESDSIEHPMVTRQIVRAQNRIFRVLRNPRPAESAEEWFEINQPVS